MAAEARRVDQVDGKPAIAGAHASMEDHEECDVPRAARSRRSPITDRGAQAVQGKRCPGGDPVG